jgi:alpha/beta hydrolase fold
MDKFAQRKESNTPCMLGRSHRLNEIAGGQVQNRRCQMRCRLGAVVSSLDRSILLMIAGLFLSVSAFSQTPGGPAGSYRTGEQTTLSPAKQDETQAGPQVKLIVDRVAAVRALDPSNIEESRRDYLFYSIFAGPSEPAFLVEDREIPSPGGSIPIPLYTPSNAWTGPPTWAFLQGGGFVAGRLDTYDMPLRAVTNRCDCPVVSAGYRLAPENRYTAYSVNRFADPIWMAGDTAEVDQNPRTPLSATPPGIFGLPPEPGLAQTPSSEAFRAGGVIDVTSLAAHVREGMRWFRRPN